MVVGRLLTSRLFCFGVSRFVIPRTAFETRKGGIYFSTLKVGAVGVGSSLRPESVRVFASLTTG